MRCPYVKSKRMPQDCPTCIHYNPDEKFCAHLRAPKPTGLTPKERMRLADERRWAEEDVS